MYDATGSYNSAMVMIIVLAVITSVLFFIAAKPRYMTK
jgi:cyanate permease